MDDFEKQIEKARKEGNFSWPGEVAQIYKHPVGMIGCPHCGVVVSGALCDTICKWCNKDFWTEMSEE